MGKERASGSESEGAEGAREVETETGVLGNFVREREKERESFGFFGSFESLRLPWVNQKKVTTENTRICTQTLINAATHAERQRDKLSTKVAIVYLNTPNALPSARRFSLIYSPYIFSVK